MNFCVEFQPVPPYSFGQFGTSQPFSASFFCHCSSRSLETWLDRLRRLSSATSGGMLAVTQSRTSFWKASSSKLKAKSMTKLKSQNGLRHDAALHFRRAAIDRHLAAVEVARRQHVGALRPDRLDICVPGTLLGERLAVVAGGLDRVFLDLLHHLGTAQLDHRRHGAGIL